MVDQESPDCLRPELDIEQRRRYQVVARDLVRWIGSKLVEQMPRERPFGIKVHSDEVTRRVDGGIEPLVEGLLH